jgi:hypothetical protein
MKAAVILIIIMGGFLIGPAAADLCSYGNWTETTPNASFSLRKYAESVVFDNKLWVIGGGHDGHSYNDVWSSPDGENWTLETAHAGFGPRDCHRLVTFNDRIWLTGRTDNLTSDVWSSTDGKTWTLVTDNAGFTPRCDTGFVVFDNRLWVIGGFAFVGGGDRFTNDVWSSPDGKTWTLETEHAGFSPRLGTGAIAFDNRLWILAGNDSTDVWSSTDGKNWTLVNEKAPFCSADYNNIVVYGDRILAIGNYEGHGVQNDIFSSSDGKNWTLQRLGNDFGTRDANTNAVFHDSLWALAGFDSLNSAKDKNDVWCTALRAPTEPTTTLPSTSLPTTPFPTAATTSQAGGIDPIFVGFGTLIAIGIGKYCLKLR